MAELLYFDNLCVGNRWTSRARTVTETDVINFAGLTGDYDPLHVDHEFARQTPFGKPIAHGLLGLGLVAGLGSNFPAVRTVAFVSIHRWEFFKPLLIGDTVHAVNEIVELTGSGRRRGRVLWRRQLVNQSGEIVQQGTFETLVERAPASTTRRDVPHPAPTTSPAASNGKSPRRRRSTRTPAD